MDSKGAVLMQKYELGRLLGQGTFAKVYYARNLKTGMTVAIKIIDKEKVMKVGMIDQIKREISVMRLVRHPNVMELYEVMASKSNIYFVIEYVKGGELFNKVAKGKLKEDVARKYFQQLISAVDYCHSRGVYHRDLKPENLLLDENGNLKVSDFGLSALSESKCQDGLLHTTCGTSAYVAPEVIDRKGYDGSKADIWSCGVILYVLLAGYLPFHDSNLMEMYRKIKIGKAEFKFPNWFSHDVRKLLTKILDPNPSTWIPISKKIVQNPWFRKGLEPKKPTIVGKEETEPNWDQIFDENLKPELDKQPSKLTLLLTSVQMLILLIIGLAAVSHASAQRDVVEQETKSWSEKFEDFVTWSWSVEELDKGWPEYLTRVSIVMVLVIGSFFFVRKYFRAKPTDILSPIVVESFPIIDFDPTVGFGIPDCCICLVRFKQDENVMVLPDCGHIFHPACIKKWLTAHRGACPMCRRDYTIVQVV